MAFRFVCTYLLLSMATPFVVMVPGLTTLGDAWQNLVQWFGSHAFGVEITVLPSDSSDTTFNYVEVACWFMIAVAVTLLWSVVDRRRRNYSRLHDALRVAVRFFLALIMAAYGANKVFPAQFGSLHLHDLQQPFGEQSPNGLLWRFMAASPAYTCLTGVVEVLGGLLLIFRRTTLLGALLCAGAMTQVFALNVCYDVPVKLFSAHLLLMSLLLIAPDLRRLVDVFVLHRATAPIEFHPYFRRVGLERTVGAIKAVAFVTFTVVMLVVSHRLSESRNHSKPPLHGIWIVDDFAAAGSLLPPLASDAKRWSGLTIDRARGGKTVAVVWFVNGTKTAFRPDVDPAGRRLELIPVANESESAAWAELHYDQPKPDELIVTGSIDGGAVEVKLHRFPESQFPLISRGFSWINEHPFFR